MNQPRSRRPCMTACLVFFPDSSISIFTSNHLSHLASVVCSGEVNILRRPKQNQILCLNAKEWMSCELQRKLIYQSTGSCIRAGGPHVCFAFCGTMPCRQAFEGCANSFLQLNSWSRSNSTLYRQAHICHNHQNRPQVKVLLRASKSFFLRCLHFSTERYVTYEPTVECYSKSREACLRPSFVKIFPDINTTVYGSSLRIW
jgi:hypothetical protein